MKSMRTARVLSPPQRRPAITLPTSRKMNAAKTALVSSIFLSAAFGTAHSEVCYKLTPFPDVIRLAEVTIPDQAVGGSHTLLVGNWTAGNVPSKPVVGSMDVSVNPAGTRIGLHGTLHGGDCAGHSDVTLDGVPGGPWNLSCDGKVEGFFNNSGTLTVINCSTLVETIAVEGKSATQP
jgi:hypothetical protein